MTNRRRALLVMLGIAALVLASFASLDLHWAEFLSWGALQKMGAFGASFFPPESSPGFLRKTVQGAGETLAM